jgi:hypothetical protein
MTKLILLMVGLLLTGTFSKTQRQLGEYRTNF